MPGEFGGTRARPRLARSASCRRSSASCRKRRAQGHCGIADAAPVDRGRQGQPRRRPGRPAGHAAADGGRLLDDRQRRPRVPPAPRRRGRGLRRHRAQRIDPAPPSARSRSTAEWRQAILDGLHEAANQDGGTSADVWDQGWPAIASRSSARRAPPSALAGQADQSWYVAYSYDRTPERKPIVVVVHGREGRLRRRGRRARGAPDPLQVVRRQPQARSAGARSDTMSAASTPHPRRRRRAAARPRAAAGHGAAVRPDPAARRHRPRAPARWSRSRGATADDIAGDPNYYVNRQAVYFVVGGVLVAGAVAHRLLAPARRSSTSIYGLLIASILAVIGSGLGGATGRAARDRPRLLLLPGLRARQGPARRRRWRPSSSTARGACTTATPPPGSCSSR